MSTVRRKRVLIAPPKGSLWPPDAADHLGIALATLRKWRQKGYGPQGYLLTRGKLAYTIQELEDYLDAQQGASARAA
ncbi:helix-turn-helix transcriptional regulator [Streptomyces sp. NPDC090077]|uniref:helix-turn-helix transcriptional regulator n=1 Tax=Streptomyces sp. NPDC090077 TaxID=3365938 RepID=UPI00382D521B